MPEENKGDNLPPNEPQKPAGTDGNTPPNGSSPDPMEELKNQVEREKARAATAQQEKEAADRKWRDEHKLRVNAEKRLKDLAGGDGAGAPAAGGAVTPDSNEEEIERLNAEKGVANLIMLNPKYQELLQKDPTLREVISDNPLSLIREYIDADDAIDQIQKKLDKRLQDSSANPPAPAPGAQPPAAGKEGEVPPPSSTIQMKGSVTPDAAVQMSAAEWEKLPKEQRLKMLSGEF